MSTVSAMTSSRAPAVVLAVAVLGLLGVVREAAPSGRRLLSPPTDQVCTAIWPPVTACAPGAHLVVVAVVVAVLAVGTLVASRFARSPDPRTRATAIVLVAVVSVAAYASARTPQSLFLLMG